MDTSDDFQKISTSKKGKKRTAAELDDDTEKAMDVDLTQNKVARPSFPPASKDALATGIEFRKVPVPPHRLTPLRNKWTEIYKPIVEQLNLQIRFNKKTRNVELKTCPATEDIANIQKASDFIQAFVLGFDVSDALALLRLDELFIDSFEVRDVKRLTSAHESRAVGRIAGKGGKTKFGIENATKTRIVVADTKIHILGSFQNIQIARRIISNLILGRPPSKISGTLSNLASRISERL